MQNPVSSHAQASRTQQIRDDLDQSRRRGPLAQNQMRTQTISPWSGSYPVCIAASSRVVKQRMFVSRRLLLVNRQAWARSPQIAGL